MAIFTRRTAAPVVAGAARDKVTATGSMARLAEGLEAIEGLVQLQDSVQVVLFGLPYSCWRCGAVSTALVALGEEGAGFIGDDLLICDDAQVLAFADRLVGDELRQLGPVGAIKARYSKTVGHAYLSNGCAHCDAIFGEFPLFHEEVPQVLALEGLAGLVRLDTVQLSVECWDELCATRWS